MIIKFFVAKSLSDAELMWIPQLCKDLLNIVLVHAKVHEMDLGALFTDEDAVSDICMRGLTLLAIDAIGIELVIGH